MKRSFVLLPVGLALVSGLVLAQTPAPAKRVKPKTVATETVKMSGLRARALTVDTQTIRMTSLRMQPKTVRTSTIVMESVR